MFKIDAHLPEGASPSVGTHPRDLGLGAEMGPQWPCSDTHLSLVFGGFGGRKPLPPLRCPERINLLL